MDEILYLMYKMVVYSRQKYGDLLAYYTNKNRPRPHVFIIKVGTVLAR